MAVERFVDAHVHFWDHAVEPLSWPFLEPGFDHPRLGGMHRLDAPRYTAEELRAEAGGVPLEKVVHVQCAGEAVPGDEAAWLQGSTDRTGWPQAIVVRARLAGPSLVEQLSAARFRAFRGVRDMEAAGDLGLDEFSAGWERLVDLGGSLEVMVSHESFAAVAAVARRRPDGLVVLGHAGLPVRRDRDYFLAWSTRLRELAREPNVVCKISALAGGADRDWTVASIRPWVQTCIDAFGPTRAMFASNWPIDRLFGRYEDLLAAYDEITADLARADRHRLFAGTAEAVYRIDDRPLECTDGTAQGSEP